MPAKKFLVAFGGNSESRISLSWLLIYCIVIFLKLYVPSAGLITTDTPLGKSGEYPSTTRKQCNTQAFCYSFKVCIFTLTYSANKFLKIHKLLKTLNASFLIIENAVAPAESLSTNGCPVPSVGGYLM